MIEHLDKYIKFIEKRGVGKNDRVADSRASYVSYLNSVSRLIEQNIGPEILNSEADINRVIRILDGRKSPSTIKKYRSAMRQYTAFVEENGLAWVNRYEPLINEFSLL